jgi:hypothetical protein
MLIPAARITSPHFFRSDAIKAAASCGEPVFGWAPSLSRLAASSLECMMALMVELSLLTMAGGVPAGAITPNHSVACSSGNPLSTVVGTFGS